MRGDPHASQNESVSLLACPHRVQKRVMIDVPIISVLPFDLMPQVFASNDPSTALSTQSGTSAKEYLKTKAQPK